MKRAGALRTAAVWMVTLLIVGCGDTQPEPAPVPTTAGSVPEPTMTAFESTARTTQHGTDGNRYILGRGAMPAATPIDVVLEQPAVWVAGAVENGTAVWFVVRADGTVTRVDATGEYAAGDASLAPGQPPLVAPATDEGSLVVLPGGSPLTHPVPLPEGGVAFVDGAGGVRVSRSGEEVRSAAEALPDARLLTDDEGSILWLSGPTDRYPHGVLGDDLEAGSVTLLEFDPAPRERTLSIPDGLVVEGISPIWIDLDGDGRREIILTLSDGASGARIAVLDETGGLVATGPAVGRGNRWRHQIAVAPLGPDGEIELVEVLTPHLGGVVGFYRLEEGQLDIVASVPGFTSHVLGSRNLDLALAADADGDGRVEVVVPTQDRTRLGAIRRSPGTAAVAWTVDLGGTLATNLAAVTLPDGSLWIAAGRSDGVLRIWPGS